MIKSHLKKLMEGIKLTALFAVLIHLGSCQSVIDVMPEFLAPLENHTVTQGRDVFFTCVVNHLQAYKVAWIKSDSRAILAIHTHMVTHNPRLSVTHNGHNTWKLHVANVQKNDSGTYMCQVNTDPMRSQMGHMVVQIPPDIMDEESSDGLVTQERGNIKLRCVSTGIPQPTVTWRREDGGNITLRDEFREKLVVKNYDGETLNLTGVLRQEMGTYLCIASNGVPPTISKRYSVQVHFPPVIKVTNQLVGAPINRNVTIQCSVEVSPRAMNTWYKENGDKLLPGPKYIMTEFQQNDYSWQMNLTIINLEKKKDFGGYVCASVNALGKAEAVVRLQELELVVETTPGSIQKNQDTKVRKKIQHNKKKLNHRQYDNNDNNNNSNNNNNNNNYLNGNDYFGTTQIINGVGGGGGGGGGSTKTGHKTERPLISPSMSPPWVVLASNCQRLCTSLATIFFIILLITIHAL